MFLKRRLRETRIVGLQWVGAVAVAAAVLDGQGLRAQQMVGPNAATPATSELWQPPPPKTLRFDPTKVDFSVGIYAQLLATRTTDTNQVGTMGNLFQEQTQGTSPSAGVFGTFHQQFSGWLGYDVNFGYTQTDEEHSVGTILTVDGLPTSATFAKSANRMNVYEFSVGYVVKAPTSSHRIQTFAEGGPGEMIYQPVAPPNGLAYNNRKLAGMFGVGADLRMTEHLGLRIEYRGLLTKTADSHFSAVATQSVFTVISEPTVSLKYTFGAHPKMQ